MKELEVQTYQFAVEGIGLVKSLEKEVPGLATSDLKQSMGAVSLKYMDALSAEENEDFASNLRACHASAKRSEELLHTLEKLTNKELIQQKEKMINDSKKIIEKLDGIIEKLIY